MIKGRVVQLAIALRVLSKHLIQILLLSYSIVKYLPFGGKYFSLESIYPSYQLHLNNSSRITTLKPNQLN